MREDEVAPRIVKELASAMPPYDLAKYEAGDLLDAGKQLAHSRRNQQILIGQIAAELWTRDRATYSWRAIEAATSVPRSTVHRWARPFLTAA